MDNSNDPSQQPNPKSVHELSLLKGPLSATQLKMSDKLESGTAVNGIHMRPVRVMAPGTEQPLTDQDRDFLRLAQSQDFNIRYLPDVKKGAKNKSAQRYKKYQSAQTLNQALSLGATKQDIPWDYSRGYILFPNREPRLQAHFADANATEAVFGPEAPIPVPITPFVVLDMYCGTKSLLPVCEKLNWKYLTMDINPDFQPDFLADVLTWDYTRDLEGLKIDIVFCSPPCTTFSQMRFAKRTRKLMKKSYNQVEQDMYDSGVKILDKTKEIISWLSTHCGTQVYFIENPHTGRMKEFMNDYPMYKVDYCAYQSDFGYKKPTSIWTNIDPNYFSPRTCPGKSCPARSTITNKHMVNAFNDQVPTEVLYRVPNSLLTDLMMAAWHTINNSPDISLKHVNFVDMVAGDCASSLPSFHSLVENLFPPEQVPDFLHSNESLLQFGLESFKQICMQEYLEAIECHTAFVGNSSLPDNLKPEEVTLPKHDGNLTGNLHSKFWVEAMAEEMDVLEKRNCWVWQDRSVAEKNINFQRCKPIPTIWIHKVKTNDKGFVYRFRSRLVVRGDLTIEGVHYSEVFAPVVSMDSVRTVLSLAASNPEFDVHQGDISAAFIHPKLTHDIWILPPPRHNRLGKDGKPQVLKLLRTLYGLKSSPLAWFECFSDTILGFAKEFPDVKVTQLISDSCIFIVEKGKDKIYTTIYVDDVLTVSTSVLVREWFYSALSSHFDLQASETGECTWLLGIRVNVDRPNNRITLSQEQAIQKIVRSQALSSDDIAITPMSSDLKLERLEKHQESIDPETCMNGLSFRSVLGSVLYISTSTRPDISFPVNLIARHVTGIGKAHIKALLRVVKYLNGSLSWGIRYFCPKLPTESMYTVGYQSATHPCDVSRHHLLRCFADADYAQSEDRKSTTGYTVVVNGGPICWRSSRQKIIAQSTAEAEIISATEAGKDVIHTRLLLKELGFPEQVTAPTILYEDNQSCIYLARNLKSRRTAKHFEIRLRFLQQMVLDKEIQFEHIGTLDQVADMLTKPLPESQFLNLRSRLLADCDPQASLSNVPNTTEIQDSLSADSTK